MRQSIFGFAVFGIALPAFMALYSCGGSTGDNGDGGAGGAGAGFGDDGSCGFNCQGSDGTNGGPDTYVQTFDDAGFTTSNCPGCTFPPIGAPACSGSPPAITIVYPYDGVLVPPNMGTISVQWTPFGTTYTEFEVDFENAATDVRIITKCTTQTQDTEQPPVASGGCELVVDDTVGPGAWSNIANQNRGGDPLTVTVRGTTDGTCATSSTAAVHLSYAQDDLLGALYYWKSEVSANGVGGQIWVKSFGDATPETQVTTNLNTTCNGCHSLSRDGVRMTVNSDDDDSDDEYGDVCASLIDMTSLNLIPQQVVCSQSGRIGGAPMNAGFGTFYPDHTEFLMSNGLQTQLAPPGPNAFLLFDGTAGAQQGNPITAGSLTAATMPDWSPDGKNVVFVSPQAVASWDGASRNDDDHVFGGSLYVMPYTGNQQFGSPTVLLQSANENNYYPSYSPEGSLIVFNRAPFVSVTQDPTCPAGATGVTGCTSTPGVQGQCDCPNDSFSNQAARIMTMPAAGGTPVDLTNANGSPTGSPVNLSNSWPKWAPFLNQYKGDQLLWVTFASTRDYGLRVRNHVQGASQYQCYPADSYEAAGAAHHSPFAANCEQPQLWMAAVDLTKAAAGQDGSFVAFWLPFQDITTHNHTPQWTQTIAHNNNEPTGPCIQSGGNCTTNPGGCCSGAVCQANGVCGTIR